MNAHILPVKYDDTLSIGDCTLFTLFSTILCKLLFVSIDCETAAIYLILTATIYCFISRYTHIHISSYFCIG